LSYSKIYLDELQENLCQGDIFIRFDDTDVIPPVFPKEVGFIVLSYTCDLEHYEKLPSIYCSPIFNLDNLIPRLIDEQKDIKKTEKIESNLKSIINSILNNQHKFYFFLTPISELTNIPMFVHLGRIFTINILYIEKIKTNRIAGLSSPWREKLGYKIGHIFNRIAIESIDSKISNSYVDNNEIICGFLEEKKIAYKK